MTALAVSRKTRAEMLVKEIRESTFDMSAKVKELHDEQLYKDLGYSSFEQCCKEEFDYKERYAHYLLKAANLLQALPDCTICAVPWTESQLRELGRLKTPADSDRVAKKVIGQVENNGKKRATAALVRKLVDEDLGVHKTKPTPEPPPEAPLFGDWIDEATGKVKFTLKQLKTLDQDVWKHLPDDCTPQMIKRLITACEELAEFLKGVIR
jgi:hypothetical protein